MCVCPEGVRGGISGLNVVVLMDFMIDIDEVERVL